MKQNGTDKQQVTHMSGAAIFPDYSPDGSEIVFAARPAGATARNIYVVPSDGGTPQQLTTVGNNVYPAFSPERQQDRLHQQPHRDLAGLRDERRRLRPDDNSPSTRSPKTRCPTGARTAPRSPTSPTRTASPDVTQSWGDIWVMNADGSGQHPITNGASWYGTAWSPDGTRIVTLDMPTRTVYTLDAATAATRRPSTRPGPQFVPGWQPRGTGNSQGEDQND